MVSETHWVKSSRGYFMVYNRHHKPLGESIYKVLATLSWFKNNVGILLQVSLCHNSSSDLSLLVSHCYLLHPEPSPGYILIQLIVILTRKDFPRWKWAITPPFSSGNGRFPRDKNNHRAWALRTAPHFLAFLLPHYLHADLFMLTHTLISYA